MRRALTDMGMGMGMGMRAAILAGVVGMACASPQPEPRYVFGWPFADTAEMAPRGGTTRGPEVTLALEPGAAWRRLQAPGLTARERDRAAILALAGEYRTSFDFLETVLYEPGRQPAAPYRSWATERVDVLEERPDFVSLQHTLVMFVEDESGETRGPFVQKHWRQDWSFEPERALAFLGDGRFALQELSEEQRSGAWSQSVWQVDDSPRYASTGRWQHDAWRSVWTGDAAWRPLPRRESSVRSDYQVLAGSHRITLLPTGWVHEQDNEKLVFEEGAVTGSRGREAGLDRYERIEGFDFTAADAYWTATAPFWSAVRTAWSERLAAGELTLSRTCDDAPGFQSSFAFAARLEQEAVPADETRAEAQRIVDCLTRDSRP
ncbi:MAG: DUF6607 family protein [Myxococcota bacterium]